ncbi:hypothetical protein F-S17_0118 [Faustovirus]|nr:hypothetical protein F-S17_0118 [Faustovirus]
MSANNSDPAVEDNISTDISDVKDLPELVASAQPEPVVNVQPALQKTEFEFGDLLDIGREICGENVKFKLEFDTQIIDGSKVLARKTNGEFMFSVRLRYRNFGRVTNDQKALVVPTYFTDMEKSEKLEIYVENNTENKNKVESDK